MDKRMKFRRSLFAAIVCIVALVVPLALGAISVKFAAVVLILIAALLLTSHKLRWPKDPRPVFLFCTAALFTVSLGDLALRVATPKGMYYRPHEMFVQRWPQLPEVFRYRANTHFSGETYGDLAAMTGDEALRETREIVFDTDERGFRNRPNEQPIDLVLLGDSFIAGNGTTQDQIVASQLQQKHGFSVYNFGVPGNPWQSWVHLSAEVDTLDLAPGACVLLAVFPGNDFDETFGPTKHAELNMRNALERFAIRYSTFRHSSPVYRLSKLASSRKKSTRVLIATDNGKNVLFYKPYIAVNKINVEEHPGFAAMTSTLDALQSSCRKRGLRFKVVILPTKYEIYGWMLEKAEAWTQVSETGAANALRTVCEAKQIDVLDLRPGILAAAKTRYEADGSLLWWRDDTHWNLAGNEVTADRLAPFVRAAPNVPLTKTKYR